MGLLVSAVVLLGGNLVQLRSIWCRAYGPLLPPLCGATKGVYSVSLVHNVPGGHASVVTPLDARPKSVTRRTPVLGDPDVP